MSDTERFSNHLYSGRPAPETSSPLRNFITLPDQCVYAILSFCVNSLATIAPVCRSWRDIVYGPEPWCNTVLTLNEDQLIFFLCHASSLDVTSPTQSATSPKKGVNDLQNVEQRDTSGLREGRNEPGTVRTTSSPTLWTSSDMGVAREDRETSLPVDSEGVDNTARQLTSEAEREYEEVEPKANLSPTADPKMQEYVRRLLLCFCNVRQCIIQFDGERWDQTATKLEAVDNHCPDSGSAFAIAFKKLKDVTFKLVWLPATITDDRLLSHTARSRSSKSPTHNSWRTPAALRVRPPAFTYGEEDGDVDDGQSDLSSRWVVGEEYEEDDDVLLGPDELERLDVVHFDGDESDGSEMGSIDSAYEYNHVGDYLTTVGIGYGSDDVHAHTVTSVGAVRTSTATPTLSDGPNELSEFGSGGGSYPLTPSASQGDRGYNDQTNNDNTHNRGNGRPAPNRECDSSPEALAFNLLGNSPGHSLPCRTRSPRGYLRHPLSPCRSPHNRSRLLSGVSPSPYSNVGEHKAARSCALEETSSLPTDEMEAATSAAGQPSFDGRGARVPTGIDSALVDTQCESASALGPSDSPHRAPPQVNTPQSPSAIDHQSDTPYEHRAMGVNEGELPIEAVVQGAPLLSREAVCQAGSDARRSHNGAERVEVHQMSTDEEWDEWGAQYSLEAERAPNVMYTLLKIWAPQLTSLKIVCLNFNRFSHYYGDHVKPHVTLKGEFTSGDKGVLYCPQLLELGAFHSDVVRRIFAPKLTSLSWFADNICEGLKYRFRAAVDENYDNHRRAVEACNRRYVYGVRNKYGCIEPSVKGVPPECLLDGVMVEDQRASDFLYDTRFPNETSLSLCPEPHLSDNPQHERIIYLDEFAQSSENGNGSNRLFPPLFLGGLRHLKEIRISTEAFWGDIQNLFLEVKDDAGGILPPIKTIRLLDNFYAGDFSKFLSCVAPDVEVVDVMKFDFHPDSGDCDILSRMRLRLPRLKCVNIGRVWLPPDALNIESLRQRAQRRLLDRRQDLPGGALNSATASTTSSGPQFPPLHQLCSASQVLPQSVGLHRCELINPVEATEPSTPITSQHGLRSRPRSLSMGDLILYSEIMSNSELLTAVSESEPSLTVPYLDLCAAVRSKNYCSHTLQAESGVTLAVTGRNELVESSDIDHVETDAVLAHGFRRAKESDLDLLLSVGEGGRAHTAEYYSNLRVRWPTSIPSTQWPRRKNSPKRVGADWCEPNDKDRELKITKMKSYGSRGESSSSTVFCNSTLLSLTTNYGPKRGETSSAVERGSVKIPTADSYNHHNVNREDLVSRKCRGPSGNDNQLDIIEKSWVRESWEWLGWLPEVWAVAFHPGLPMYHQVYILDKK